MVLILFLVVVLFVAFRATSADERARFARTAIAAVQEAMRGARNSSSKEPFLEALRVRTPRALVTPTLVGLNTMIFLFMLAGSGSLSDPATLVGWGGNFGPRTTNGEWWRLAATTCVHSGMLQLLVNIAGLFQLGLVLERLVGHVAFAVTYAAAGVCASLVSLTMHPVTVNAGASGAICGLHGLLLALLIWTIRRESAVTIPFMTLKRIAPAAAVFMVFNVATGDSAALFSGLLAGVLCGVVLTKNIAERKPPARFVAATVAASLAIAVMFARPLRGMAYVKPEIERVVAVEDRTVSAYATHVDRFKDGRMNAEKLAQVIDRTISPELQAARTRLKTLKNVPHEQQELVAAADEYLRLRDESWRLRADALHTSSMPALRKADRTERAALEALQKLKSAELR